MTEKVLITDEMIEEEAESRYPVTRHISPESSPYVGAKKTFVHGAKWARDFLSTHTREVAEKAADKEYAKGFALWLLQEANQSYRTGYWVYKGEDKTTDQLLSLYDEHLEKEKIK